LSLAKLPQARCQLFLPDWLAGFSGQFDLTIAAGFNVEQRLAWLADCQLQRCRGAMALASVT
jgi:hypothetical protein